MMKKCMANVESVVTGKCVCRSSKGRLHAISLLHLLLDSVDLKAWKYCLGNGFQGMMFFFI